MGLRVWGCPQALWALLSMRLPCGGKAQAEESRRRLWSERRQTLRSRVLALAHLNVHTPGVRALEVRSGLGPQHSCGGGSASCASHDQSPRNLLPTSQSVLACPWG